MRHSILISLLCLLCSLPAFKGNTDSESELNILLGFKNSLVIPSNSTLIFNSWSNSSNSPCEFAGVRCNSNNSVTTISLNSIGISGTVPFDSLCQLPSLTNLSLGSNGLTGKLTAGLQSCTSLLTLDLAFNYFSGTVPDLSPLRNLQILNISDNLFIGPFPWSSLGNLTDLRVLSLGDNTFARSGFPYEVLNLTKLNWLYLSNTNIGGKIPPEIGNLTELRDLELSDNFIYGEIPPEITRLTNLFQLELYNNSLTGKIPAGFGNLTRLQFFDASMNGLEGNLSELRSLSNLISLQLYENNFSGEVPSEFGDFWSLVNLSLYTNRLTGQLPQKLGSWAEFNFIDVSTNFLSGPIPPDMCKRGTMIKLLILENNFSGEIPGNYANCTTLERFRVSSNNLSGEVPAGIWSLPNVNIIDLQSNNFVGQIGSGIGEANSLYQLYLSNNRFSGQLPAEITGTTSLVNLDVSYNNLSGEIPAGIGKLNNLVSLNLHNNSFSGTIPDSIGSCFSLSTIDLSNNEISGEIPASLGDLTRLNSLNLSNNRLSGQIPANLASLKLSFLSLINNELSGPVPTALSIDAYSSSFSGNPALCADNSVHFLQQCSGKSGHGSSDQLTTVLTCLLSGAAVALACLGLFIFIKKRRSAMASTSTDRFFTKDSWDLKSFRVLSFDEQEIIESIKQENLIGQGGSGDVYRVKLGSGTVVAVKHILNEPLSIAATSDNIGGGTAAMLGPKAKTRRLSSLRCSEFDAEVGTLSSIRHVNVVKLYCSITSEDSSLLVYEYLPNGSLWEKLHTVEGQKLGILDWETRFDIALGAARGLEYLHHGCERPILHRDVKSSNILLDECFKPRIADFGLAKILRSASLADSSSQIIAGTHGYIAPEYAYTWWKVNEKSDVYSFGVVLMELVTGKKPIEAEYGENKDIVYWVSGKIDSKEKVMGLADARIKESWEREEAVMVLRIAVLCTARVPSGRPSMRRVVQLLEEVMSCRSFVLPTAKDQKIEAKPSP